MSALRQQVGGDHYKSAAIQPIEFIHANDIPFAEGNVIKYVCRWRDKNGLADLRKARHYLDLLIELEEKKIAAVKPAPAAMAWGGIGTAGSAAVQAGGGYAAKCPDCMGGICTRMCFATTDSARPV